MIRPRSFVQIAAGAACLIAMSLGIGWGTAHAQLGGGQGGGIGGGQGGGGFGGGQGGLGGGGGFGGGGMGGQGFGPPQGAQAGVAIAQDDAFLYIVRGPEVLKLQKRDLHVVASVNLPPMARRMGGMGSPGGPPPSGQ